MFDFGLLRPEQCGPASKLVRESFRPELRPYLPLCQHGAARALRDAAAQRDGTRLLVTGGTREATVSCFADLRVNVNQAFLSYIVVNPDQRGKGLASALMRHLDSLLPVGMDWELDVLTDNIPARRLYARFGFTTTGRLEWRSSAPIASPPEEDGKIIDKAETDRGLAQYGFAYVRCELDGAHTTYGLPSRQVIRVPADGPRTVPPTILRAYPEIKTAFFIQAPSTANRGRLVASSLRLRRDGST